MTKHHHVSGMRWAMCMGARSGGSCGKEHSAQDCQQTPDIGQSATITYMYMYMYMYH